MSDTLHDIYGVAMPDMIEYDEFSYFHENAAEWDLPYDAPPTVDRVATELADGRTITADEDYLRDKIRNPNGNRLAEGYKQIMPSFAGVIPEDDLGRLIDFLKSNTRTVGDAASGEATR